MNEAGVAPPGVMPIHMPTTELRSDVIQYLGSCFQVSNTTFGLILALLPEKARPSSMDSRISPMPNRPITAMRKSKPRISCSDPNVSRSCPVTVSMPTAAVLLGGLLIWGLQPGPLLFVEQKDFVWGLIASMYLGNLAGLIVVLTTVPLFASILRIPFSIIAPVIVVICAIGAFTVHSAQFDIWLMLIFGIIGYVFKKLDYPLAPLVLALVLGDRAEDAFRQSMLASKGGLGIFWNNALVGTIMTLAVVGLAWSVIGGLRERYRLRSA